MTFRNTFEFICEKLLGFVERKSTHWRQSVNYKCRVAIALWRLGGGADYRSIGKHFGLGKSTVFSVLSMYFFLNNPHLLCLFYDICNGEE